MPAPSPSSIAQTAQGREADIITFFEVSLDLLVIRDMAGLIQRVSPSILQILGYTADEIRGQRVLDLVHPEDREHTARCMVQVELRDQNQPVQAVANRYRHKAGHHIWLDWRAQRFGDSIYAIARDVTDKRAAEEALHHAKAAAEAANQAKSDFLANMSHEIRTPLNGILGMIDVLERTKLSNHQAEILSLVRTSGETLTRLMSDVLDMSKAEAGHLRIEHQAFDLELCLNRIIETHQRLAGAKGLSFAVACPENLLGPFLGDEVRLTQVLNNLLSNAIKFTASGGIELRFQLCESVGEPTLLSFEVEDTGIGFDDDQAGKMFQRFSQADASITRRFGGSGLGLSICQSLVHRMGGHISARSTPGVGSCFRVELPIPRAASLPLPEVVGLVLPSRPVNILLAEDHPVNRKLIQLLLADLPVNLTMVQNGQEAVEAFQNCRYDAILMDMQMPVMDGLRATQSIRAYEASHQFMTRTPIVMVTANALDEHRIRSFQAGADLHLSKPITSQDLKSALGKVLGQTDDATGKSGIRNHLSPVV